MAAPVRSFDGFRSAAHEVVTSLPLALGSGAVRIEQGADWLEYSVVGAAGDGVIDGSAVRYPSAFPGVEVRYTLSVTGTKEDIVLAGPESSSSFSFDVATSSGLHAVPTADGGTSFVGERGRVFTFAAPFMVDSAPGGGARSDAVSMRAVPQSGGFRLEVAADRSWLEDRARVWPVTIDPAVVFDQVTAQPDCYVRSGTPTTSSCAATTLDVENTTSDQRRALLRYDDVATAIPDDAIVTSAQLMLYLASRTGTDTATSLTLHEVTRSWTTGATWNTYNGTSNWTTAGGDFGSTAVDTRNVAGVGFLQSFWPTTTVQKWVNGSLTNNGFLLKKAVQGGDRLSFTSYNSATSSHWPLMLVYYEHRWGDRGIYSYHRDTTSDRAGLAVNLSNGALSYSLNTFSLPGTGLGVDLTHSWHSNDDYSDTPFGSRWRLNLHDLGIFGDGSAVWSSPEGPIGVFQPATNTTACPSPKTAFTAPDGANADLCKTGTNTYELTYRADQHKILFDTFASDHGFQVGDKDRSGNQITWNWDTTNERPTTIVDTQNRTTTLSYGANDELSSITDYSGRAANFTYASGGCDCVLTGIEDAEGGDTLFDYDAGGMLNKITDPRGNVTFLVYDGSDRVDSITRLTDVPNWVGFTTDFTYTPGTLGGYTQVTDPRGNTTRHDYDVQGRVTKVTDALGHTRDRAWTPNNNVQSYNGNSSSVVYNLTYNTNNVLTQAQAPASQSGNSRATTYLTYPSSGFVYQPDSQTDPQQSCQSYRYDSVGRLTEVHAGLVPTSNSCAGQNSSVTYVNDYNTNGTLKTQQAPGGNCASTPKVRCTVYAYTYAPGPGPLPLTQMVVTPPSPLGATTTDLDTAGRTAKVTDGRGKVTRYSYDDLDRITQILYNNTTTCSSSTTCTTYAYDGNGNLTSRVDNTGTTNFTYDKLNRLTKKDLPSADADCSGQGGMTFTYDAAGNVATLCDAGGTVTYQYDVVNNTCWQLLGTSSNTCASPPSGSVTYTYDNDDRRTATVYPTTPSVTMSAEYFDDGNLKKIEANKATTPTATLLTRRAYTYAIGTNDTALRRTMTDETGTVTTYGYDIHNRLCWTKTGAVSGTCTTPPSGADRWIYAGTAGDNDNRTSQVVGGITTTYQYNEANQLCWVYTGTSANNCATVPSGASVPAYDGAGNEITRPNGQSASYNDKGQTSSFTVSGTTTNATYADADSADRTAFGGTNFYSSPQGINMTRTSGTNTHYLRDDQGALVSQRVGAGGAQRYYVYDGLGSVVAMVNSSAGIDQSYSYDAWGNITGSSGSVTNPFQFASGHLDSVTGLTKFGTRYYDPTLGRWVQTDPVGPVGNYSYAGLNPVSLVDPTGRWFEMGGDNGPCSWSEESSSRFDYSGACRAHDRCYDRANGVFRRKLRCDRAFERALYAEGGDALNRLRAGVYSSAVYAADILSAPF